MCVALTVCCNRATSCQYTAVIDTACPRGLVGNGTHIRSAADSHAIKDDILNRTTIYTIKESMTNTLDDRQASVVLSRANQFACERNIDRFTLRQSDVISNLIFLVGITTHHHLYESIKIFGRHYLIIAIIVRSQPCRQSLYSHF